MRSPNAPEPAAPAPAPDVEPLVARTRFDADGLVVVVAQDRATGVVRMVAWANAEALRRTAATGLATFWSRSRGALWQKGETTGHVLRVADMRLDCDGDAVLYAVDAVGPSCHTGRTSCFYRRPDGTAGGSVAPGDPPLVEDDGPPEHPAAILPRLAAVIASRRGEPADKSYVASLFAKGLAKINAKITEEAREVTEALPGGDRAHIAHEAADVLFHLMVGLEAAGVSLEDVFGVLRGRFGTSGHVEKASRPAKTTEGGG
jgi:phosphoribosyl-ATP pyrophosphohydrolase/phosphoribosyl-AMP cyclohydrolase